MNFQSQDRPLSGGGLDQVCGALIVAASQVWAVLAVETHGFGFLQDRRP